MPEKIFWECVSKITWFLLTNQILRWSNIIFFFNFCSTKYRTDDSYLNFFFQFVNKKELKDANSSYSLWFCSSFLTKWANKCGFLSPCDESNSDVFPFDCGFVLYSVEQKQIWSDINCALSYSNQTCDASHVYKIHKRIKF